MIDKCPQCGYSLRGLPAEHACPECGLRYDAASRVWKGKVPLVAYAGFVGIFGGLPALINFLRSAHPALALAIACVLAAFIGLLLVVVIRATTRGVSVTAVCDGLWVEMGAGRRLLIHWSDMFDVKVHVRKPNAKPMVIISYFKQGGRRKLNMMGAFKNRQDADDLIRVIHDRGGRLTGTVD